jgi:hypothetical protein
MPKVAAIITIYFRNSHADVIATRFMEGFPSDEGVVPPKSTLVSMYLDQVDKNDMGVAKAAEHGVPIFPSIRQALTLGGQDLAVDGVLCIGEHGDYPRDEWDRQMYPRRHLFEQICGVFAQTAKVVPVFIDKHLSYNWPDAQWMLDRAKQLGVPLMAGSSLPVAWRQPELELPLETDITDAIVLGYGPLEAYGYHTIEALQCMVERRKGGERGVKAVTVIKGQAVWDAGKKGRWSKDLFEAALSRVFTKLDEPPQTGCPEPLAVLIEYLDGLNAAAIMLNGYIVDWAVALRANGQVVSTEIALEYGAPFSHFGYMSRNIEQMFRTGRPVYPVERTAISTGITNAMMESNAKGGLRIETPHLRIPYRSYDKPPIRAYGHTRPGKTGEGYKPIGYF